MSREIRRVPLDFTFPLRRTWDGYIDTVTRKCPHCDGSQSTAAWWFDNWVRFLATAEAWPDHPDNAIIDSDRPVVPGLRPLVEGLAGDRYVEGGGIFALSGNHSAVYFAILEAAGLPRNWGSCEECHATGSHPDDIVYNEEEDWWEPKWEPTEPPTGEGWQMWQTVSEGGPASHVHATAEGLAAEVSVIEHMTFEAALQFVEEGWAPSMVGLADGTLLSGPQHIGGMSS